MDILSVNPTFIAAIIIAAGTTLTGGTFDLSGNHASVLSGMVNGLVDFNAGGVGIYGGGGFGRARVKTMGDSDSAWAWQLIAGVYAPISDNIDVGLKYRYFRTGHLNFNDSVDFAGATTATCGTTADLPCTGGTATFGSNGRFSSHSLLASLTYNFGGVAAAPPP